jgi:hypothetical protein
LIRYEILFWLIEDKVDFGERSLITLKVLFRGPDLALRTGKLSKFLNIILLNSFHVTG